MTTNESTMVEKLANCHPKLTRNNVWCTVCGFSQAVSSAYAFKHGWPKHCGYTMTIDSPEERTAALRHHLGDQG